MWKRAADLCNGVGVWSIGTVWTRATFLAIEAQKNPHVVAAFVRVAVPPVRIADRRHAVRAPAIRRVGDADGLGIVGRGKEKFPPGRRKERA